MTVEDFRTPEFRLTDDLANLPERWAEAGVDADDFCTCGKCGEFFIDKDGCSIPCKCERGESS